jgi:hypothetical protein
VNIATLNPPSLAETITTKSFIRAAGPRALDLPAEFR